MVEDVEGTNVDTVIPVANRGVVEDVEGTKCRHSRGRTRHRSRCALPQGRHTCHGGKGVGVRGLGFRGYGLRGLGV